LAPTSLSGHALLILSGAFPGKKPLFFGMSCYFWNSFAGFAANSCKSLSDKDERIVE